MDDNLQKITFKNQLEAMGTEDERGLFRKEESWSPAEESEEHSQADGLGVVGRTPLQDP